MRAGEPPGAASPGGTSTALPPRRGCAELPVTQRRRRRPGDPPPGGGALPRLGPLPPSLPPGRIIPPRRAVTSAGGAAASPPLPQRPDGSEPRLAMQAGKAAGSRDAGRPLQATMKRGYDVLRDPHLNKVRAAGTGAPRRPGWPGAEGGSPFPSPPPGTDKPSAAGRCLRSGSRARRRRRRRGGGRAASRRRRRRHHLSRRSG